MQYDCLSKGTLHDGKLKRSEMIDATLQQALRRSRSLTVVKVVHTAVWAFFVLCIMALPVAGWMRRFDLALVLTVFILIECLILAVNRGRCPLTVIAARYSSDQSDAFDIYLPEWLAGHNKIVFGSLFALNEAIVLWQWRH